jgi:hypothetical protein
MRARREKVEEFGPLLIGVDPAHMGADRTSIAWRRGHKILKVESRRGLTTMEVAGWINAIIRDEKPARVYVDVGGLGVGIVDRLHEQGHRCVTSVNFGGKPVEPPPLDELGKPLGGPANRRSEMWLGLKNTLEAGRFQLPDSDELQADLTSVGYKYDSSGRLLLESKIDAACPRPTPEMLPHLHLPSRLGFRETRRSMLIFASDTSAYTCSRENDMRVSISH